MADKKALLIKMDVELHRQLKVKTAERGENMTTVVLKLIEDYLRSSQKDFTETQ